VSRGAEADVYIVTVIYFQSNEKARFKNVPLVELRRVVRGILLYDYCCGRLRCMTPNGRDIVVGEGLPWPVNDKVRQRCSCTG
jgi:hypothetical protein